PALLDDAERFVKGIRQHMAYTGIAIGVPDVIRRYVPMARSGAKRFSDNKDYLFGKINKLVKRRRREIEDTPLDQPLESHDMLTSMIVAKTPRDFNCVKTVEGEGL